MAKQVRLTNGQVAVFDDGETLEYIDSKLKESGLERVKGGMIEKIVYPVTEAAVGVLGLPGQVQEMGRTESPYTPERLLATMRGQPAAPSVDTMGSAPRPKDIRGLIERLGLYGEKAETFPGQVAQTVTRNVLSAPMVATRVPAVVSGVAEEVASLPFRETPLEPYARLVGAVVAPAGMAAVSGRSPVQRMAAEEMAGISPQEVALAKRIQDEARLAGAPVTAIEAMQRATGQSRGLPVGGATRLPELQRMIESSRGGGPVMRDFMARREAETGQTLRSLAPTTQETPNLGQMAQQAAKERQARAAAEVSQRVGPEFRRIEAMPIPADDFNAIIKDRPIINSVYNTVKSSPEWREISKDLPENSVGFVEVMRQALGDKISEAVQKGQKNKARVFQNAYDDLKTIADDAVGGDYQAALTATRQARQELQAPLESSPIARIAETSQTPQQFASLFARNASEINLTPQKVRDTIKAFNESDPILGRSFVSQYIKAEIEKIPETAARAMTTGQRFSQNVFGNETQRQNLLAAYGEAYGNSAKLGLDRLMKALKAQGERLPVGSPTAEKGALEQRSLSKIKQVGKPIEAVANLADTILNGNYAADFARAITSPQGVDALVELSTKPISNAQAGAAAVAIQRLIYGTEQ